MPSKAMTQSSDSQNPSVRSPRPYRRVYWLTPAALEEIEEADREELPMDALPQIEIKTAPPSGDDYGGF